ncbi:hypothetical protein [Xanthomonas campestris]|uniref:hypothetical protein n=1 Tax=Xanthomonas campestris TaxID=339 RepID=UPI002B2262FC|nr:hypothetical protein [Xanthomonas campestris]MEA9657821.1 hypothetical protein [Xanthomonas campestris pv. raphani]
MTAKHLTVALATTLALAACSQDQGSASKTAAPTQQVKPAAKPVSWEPAIFNLDSPTVEIVDTVSFFTAFEGRSDRLIKGEYETSEEFKARTADLEKFFAPISFKNSYLFQAEHPEMKYNADEQRYEATWTQDCYESTPIRTGVSCGFGSKVDSQHDYEGRNAFGTSAQVRSEKGRDFYFNFTKRNFAAKPFRQRYGYRLPAPCPLAIDQARAFKGMPVRIAYVIMPVEPSMTEGSSRFDTPTVADPIDRWFESKIIGAKLVASVCYVIGQEKPIHVQRY